MKKRPDSTEAAQYYFTYINRVPGDDVLQVLEAQTGDVLRLFEGISEEASLLRYAPGKWSIRDIANHINDGERVFVFRAFWFARGFDTPLPSFDQDSCVVKAVADEIDWKRHVDEFRAVRESTLAFFRNMPEAAWTRGGIASDNPVTVNAIAYIIAGHVEHHLAVLKERYL